MSFVTADEFNKRTVSFVTKDEFDNRLSAVENRLDNRLSAVENRLGTLEEKTHNIETKLEALKNSFEEWKSFEKDHESVVSEVSFADVTVPHARIGYPVLVVVAVVIALSSGEVITGDLKSFLTVMLYGATIVACVQYFGYYIYNDFRFVFGEKRLHKRVKQTYKSWKQSRK